MKLTLRHISESIGGKIEGDGRISIKGISSLLLAEKGDISFLADLRIKEQVKATKASALITKRFIDYYHGPQLILDNPYLAYAKVATLFASPIPRFPGISEKAFIGEKTSIGKNVSIYPFTYIGHEAVIGDEVIIFPGVYVGDRVTIGAGSIIYPNAVVMPDCIIGKEVIIYGGAIVGSDGFGYVRDGDIHIKIPQTGIVHIEDRVELGANSTVDKASLGTTLIKKGVKIDNHVQIAHNVVVDENTIIVAQAGIAGSARIGKNVVVGPQAGVVDHIEIGDNTIIVGKSGVAKSIPPGQVVSGIPVVPHRQWLQTTSYIKKLPELSKKFKVLENRVKELEDQLKGSHKNNSTF